MQNISKSNKLKMEYNGEERAQRDAKNVVKSVF
jgi:hypothetical protein